MYEKRPKFTVLKIIIAAIAVINLVVLFRTHYDFSGIFPDKTADTAAATTAATDESAADTTDYQITFDSDTLVYDGSGTPDLLTGVVLQDKDGNEVDADIFVSISTESRMQEKTILYTANVGSEQVSAKRTLLLENYSGPSIHLPDSLPAVDDDNLDEMLNLLKDDPDFSADDGYGNDLRNAVVMKYTTDSETGTTVHFVFSVTNAFNDVASAEASLTMDEKPVLLLTQSEVTIHRGTPFTNASALSYVASATDTDGSSLSQYISISGTVDSMTAGTYTLTFTARSQVGSGTSSPKTLTVIVE